MNTFCSLLVSKDLISDEKELNLLDELGYEVWDYEDETFICNTVLYTDDEDDTDVVSYDDIQFSLVKMANVLDVPLSEISICMSTEKGE